MLRYNCECKCKCSVTSPNIRKNGKIVKVDLFDRFAILFSDKMDSSLKMEDSPAIVIEHDDDEYETDEDGEEV